MNFTPASTVLWSSTFSAPGSPVAEKTSRSRKSGSALMAQSCVEAIVKACSWEQSAAGGGTFLPPLRTLLNSKTTCSADLQGFTLPRMHCFGFRTERRNNVRSGLLETLVGFRLMMSEVH